MKDSRTPEFETRNTEGKPTYTPLFRYPIVDIHNSRLLLEDSQLFVNQRANNIRYWNASLARVQGILDNLGDESQDLTDYGGDRMSSIAVALTYLKLREELQAKNVSDQDIFDFFKKVLYFNNSQHVAIIRPKGMRVSNEQGYANRFNQFTTESAQRHGNTSFALKLLKDRPVWFKGTQSEFEDLADRYSSFTELLNPERRGETSTQGARIAKANSEHIHKTGRPLKLYFGMTLPEFMPDWLIDTPDIYPDISRVRLELEQDQQELEETFRQKEVNTRKQDLLSNSYNIKAKKAMEWLNSRFNQVKGQLHSFGDLIIFLNIFTEEMTAGTDVNRNKFIRDFIESEDRIRDRECLGLWVENILESAKIIEHGIITPNGKDALKLFISAVDPQGPDQAKQDFRKFRDINKQGFNSLAFELAPLVQKMDRDDLELFSEFISECEPQEGTDLGLFLTDVILQNIQHLKQVEPTVRKSYESYVEFLGKFIRRNHKWLYQQYQKVLIPIQTELSVENLNIEPTEAGDENRQLISEFENDLQETEYDETSDWQFFYSVDRQDHELSLVEITGNSSQEQSKFLQHFFVIEGVSCSIKPSSVIRALKGKTRSPEYVEQIAHRKEVKEQEWKKTKRGAVRIFYRISPEDKRIVFFIHQKQDWSYGF